MLKASAGVHITHIAYRGVAPATLDMIAGHVDLVSGTIPALLPFVREGRIRALAVSSANRSLELPDVPGMRESGFDDFDVLNYFGLVAPAGTPAFIVARINQTLAQAMKHPELASRFRTDALEPATPGPEALATFIRADYDRWRAVADRQGLRTDSL